MSAQPDDHGQDAELRVLSGCHAGARAPLAEALRIGAGDDCDLIVSDMVLPPGAQGWLHATGGHWKVLAQPRPAGAANDAAGPGAAGDAWVPPTAWGGVVRLGGIAITVSAPHASWQALPVGEAVAAAPVAPAATAEAEPAPAQELALPDGADATPAPRETPAPVVVDAAAPAAAAPPPPVARARSWHPAWVVGAALCVLLLGVFVSLLTGRGPAPAAPAAATAAPAPADPARQQQMLRGIQRAVAAVDPALRLQIDPLPDGRARVSGWVPGIEQLDRLAEGLATVRPTPVLAVRTAPELLDDLMVVGNATGAPLRFELPGAGRVKALGAVLTATERDRVLSQLRERLPPGIELVDALRVAEQQGPAILEWLRVAGFGTASANWDAQAQQFALALDIEPGRRPALESLLARDGTPLSGIAFTLRVRETAQAAAAPAGSVALVHASVAPLPFRIRGVVGGPAPYVVLGDGSKLQPGGQRAGWRLAGIEPDRLVFEGPRRLVVSR
jgi:type III secretion protein D